MIVSFRHRGLRRLFEEGDRRGVNADYAARILRILQALHAAPAVEQMNIASFRLHRLQGDLAGLWSVTVRANWRIVFRFEDSSALDVDLVDYH